MSIAAYPFFGADCRAKADGTPTSSTVMGINMPSPLRYLQINKTMAGNLIEHVIEERTPVASTLS